jgi:hypothetical protein
VLLLLLVLVLPVLPVLALLVVGVAKAAWRPAVKAARHHGC